MLKSIEATTANEFKLNIEADIIEISFHSSALAFRTSLEAFWHGEKLLFAISRSADDHVPFATHDELH